MKEFLIRLYLKGYRFVKRLFVSRKKTSDGRKIIKNHTLLAGLCFFFGLLAGYTIVSVVLTGAGVGSGGSLFRQLMGKSVPIEGAAPDGSFLFSSFENDKELGAWHGDGVVLSISDKYPADGQKTMQVSLTQRSPFRSVILADLLRSRRGGSDWSGYKSLGFTVFAPLRQKLPFTVKITDVWGKQYKKSFDVTGGEGFFIELFISDMTDVVQVSKIDSIAFQLPAKTSHTELYLDHVRLLPFKEGETNAMYRPVSAETGMNVSAPSPEQARVHRFGVLRKAWLLRDPDTQGEVVRVPFVVKNETPIVCKACSVEGGIPLPAGEVYSLDHIRLRNIRNEDIAFTPGILARWPDGSIKWAGVHFDTNLAPSQGLGFFLDYGPELVRPRVAGGIKTEDSENALIVDTGPLRVKLGKQAFYLYDDVRLDLNGDGLFDDSEILSEKAFLRLNFKGDEFFGHSSGADFRLAVEEQGPTRVVVRAEGWLANEAGKRFCKVILRYFFYAGKSDFKVAHTLIYTGYPANLYNESYAGKKLPENEMIDSFGLTIPFVPRDGGGAVVNAGQWGNPPLRLPADKKFRYDQLKWDNAELSVDGGEVTPSAPLSGWLSYSEPGRGIGIKVRKARENFPKGFNYDPASKFMTLELWPKTAGPLDLQTTELANGPDALARGSAFGLGKTHEIMLYFNSGDAADAAGRLEAFEERLVIRTNPYWVDAAEAFGRLYPVAQIYRSEEQVLEKLFMWAYRQPQAFRWFGMLDFGDTLTWWRNSDESGIYADGYGWHPVGRWGWYNVEGAGTHTGALIQFLRSGDWRYFQFGENLVRHVMDVDTVHYNTVKNDPRLARVLSDQYSRVGSMHRHNADHWGGRNDVSSHTNITGLMLYYYLTGDPRALEVAKESGEYFLSEPFTFFGHPDQAPARAIANALWGESLLFEATGDVRYKSEAQKLAGIFVKGQQADGSFLSLYNPQNKNWSGDRAELFMTWYIMPALIQYHQLTGDTAVENSILRLTDYLINSARSSPSILNGVAYAYFLTGNARYADLGRHILKEMMQQSVVSRNPLLDGMIYDKPIYHRPNNFLYSVPYVFSMLEEHYWKNRVKK